MSAIYSMYIFFADQDRGKYKGTGIRHTLDMWHGAKGLAKRINAVCCTVKNQIDETSI